MALKEANRMIHSTVPPAPAYCSPADMVHLCPGLGPPLPKDPNGINFEASGRDGKAVHKGYMHYTQYILNNGHKILIPQEMTKDTPQEPIYWYESY
jgi:hypothetical protein